MNETTNPTDLAARRAILQGQKEALDDTRKTVTNQIKDVDAAIIRAYQNSKVQRMTVDGRTTFIKQTLSVKIVDKVLLLDAARELGIMNMLTMNANTLRGYIKDAYLHDDELDELVIQADRLPKCLQGAVKMEELTTVGCTRA